MLAMLALIVVLLFPMILGLTFLAASRWARRMPGGLDLLTRYEGLLFFAALCIPFGVVAADLVQRDGLAMAGVAWPSVASLPVPASVGISLLMGMPTGVALYYIELLWAVSMANGAANRAMPKVGATSADLPHSTDFLRNKRNKMMRETPRGDGPRRNQSLESFGRYMGLSAILCAMEELIWRGFVVSVLSSWGLSPALALAASAAMFAAHHLSFGVRTAAMKAFCGLVWGCMFVFTGSLLASFISHLTFQYFVWQRLERRRRRHRVAIEGDERGQRMELAA